MIAINKIILTIGTMFLLSFFQTHQISYSLTVKVDELRNSKGLVQFALYNKDGQIPDEKYKHYYKMGTAKIKERQATFTFLDLPPGQYAVNILHDENENGKIDKKLLLPKEGVGFSNYNKIGLMNQPKFSKASFTFQQDTTVFVKIIYL